MPVTSMSCRDPELNERIGQPGDTISLFSVEVTRHRAGSPDYPSDPWFRGNALIPDAASDGWTDTLEIWAPITT